MTFLSGALRSLFAAALLVAFLTGCGGSARAPAGTPPAPDTPADAGESALVTMLLDLHEAAPDNGVVIYTLAKQMDREERTDDALAWLRRLEASPWDDLLEDADFPNTASHPTYAEVAARLTARARTVNRSDTAAVLLIPDLAPEGTAWDPQRREVLLSSGRLRKVVAVGEDGRVRDVTPEAQDGLLAVLGMEVDDHDRLWVASTAAPFMRGYADALAGTAAVFAFDLETGETVGSWEAELQPALLNDLTVARDGAVYVTDSQNARVLRLDTAAETWTTVGSSVEYIGLNGLALSGDEGALFVTDFLGLTRIDLATGAAERLPSPPETPYLGGIDGLAYADGMLIAIQNVAGPGRVWRIALSDDERYLKSAELLEAGHPAFANPTTGAVAGDAYYFLANPKLQPTTATGVTPLPEGGRLMLLRLPLEGSAE